MLCKNTANDLPPVSFNIVTLLWQVSHVTWQVSHVTLHPLNHILTILYYSLTQFSKVWRTSNRSSSSSCTVFYSVLNLYVIANLVTSYINCIIKTIKVWINGNSKGGGYLFWRVRGVRSEFEPFVDVFCRLTTVPMPLLRLTKVSMPLLRLTKVPICPYYDRVYTI